MMRTLLAFALCLGTPLSLAAAQGAAGGATKASEVPLRSVLELYTSQGCSSCPPADALLKSYTERRDVVALTFAVDYWDYLGWKDTLARPKYSERQRAYARTRGDGMVYTPQMVVNGRAHVNGARADEIDRAIKQTRIESQVPVRLRIENGKLVIDASAAADGATIREATIWLAVLQKKVDVPIRTGENRGRSIAYHNVVRDLTSIGMWSGQPMTIKLERQAIMPAGAESCVVLLQKGTTGPIIGAAELPVWRESSALLADEK